MIAKSCNNYFLKNIAIPMEDREKLTSNRPGWKRLLERMNLSPSTSKVEKFQHAVYVKDRVSAGLVWWVFIFILVQKWKALWLVWWVIWEKHKDTVPSTTNTYVYLLYSRFFINLSGLKSHLRVYQPLGCFQKNKNIKTKQKKSQEMILTANMFPLFLLLLKRRKALGQKIQCREHHFKVDISK